MGREGEMGGFWERLQGLWWVGGRFWREGLGWLVIVRIRIIEIRGFSGLVGRSFEVGGGMELGSW